MLAATSRTRMAATIPVIAAGRRSFSASSTARQLQSERQNTYGFVGLGQMGYWMLHNLIQGGAKAGGPTRRYVVLEPNADAVKRFMVRKEKEYPNVEVKVVETPAELALLSSRIVSMIPTSKHVESVYTGSSDSVLSALKSGKLSAEEIAATWCMDESTIEMDRSRNVGKAIEEAGGKFVDAPVSGGVIGAEKATLTIMVGASSKQVFEDVKPTLGLMGKKVLHCGDMGAGLAAKICNNMMLGISMLGLSEAMTLGKKLGLDMQLLGDIINTSTGQSWASSTNFPVPEVTIGSTDPPAHREYAGGFVTKLQHKDLALARNAAEVAGVKLRLGPITEETFRPIAQESHDYANKDFSIMYKYVSEELQK